MHNAGVRLFVDFSPHVTNQVSYNGNIAFLIRPTFSLDPTTALIKKTNCRTDYPIKPTRFYIFHILLVIIASWWVPRNTRDSTLFYFHLFFSHIHTHSALWSSVDRPSRRQFVRRFCFVYMALLTSSLSSSSLGICFRNYSFDLWCLWWIYLSLRSMLFSRRISLVLLMSLIGFFSPEKYFVGVAAA